MTDLELLRDYASSNSEDAFTALVQRYTGLVYSAALRQTGDLHTAEEIAQVVFIILARKAAGLPRETVLPGWLWRTTRFVALNSMRKEVHRRKTEQEAASFYRTETERAWLSLAPLLDEALASLGEKDRNSVILRFFEHKSLREIAEGLGTSEDGAQKRVSRALEKLRTTFLKQGIAVSATAMVGAISAKAVEAAPRELAGSLTRGVLVGAGSASSTASSVLHALEQMRRRALALWGAGVALVLLLAWLSVRLYQSEAGVSPPGRAPNALPVARQAAAPLIVGNVAPGQGATPNSGRIRLVLRDAQTHRPVSKAQLSVYWSAGFPYAAVTKLLTTDGDGQASLDYDSNAEERWNLLGVILKPGFVPKFVNWAAARGDFLEDMPADYTTTLERGSVAGGVVLDFDNQPVPDAQVLIQDRSRPNVAVVTPAEREGVALAHTETTDSQGMWICDHLPADLDSVRFAVSHPEYLAVAYGSGKLNATTNLGGYVAESDLRTRTAIFRLQRGLVVAGTVTDADGQSLAGATVIRNRLWWDGSARRTTDAQGRFRFGDIGPGELVLMARADGFLETDLVIQPTGRDENLRFALARAATLRGRILDDQNNAVPRAHISASGESYDNGNRYWRTTSDAEGRFQWLSAPPTQTNYQISAWGYKTVDPVLIPNGIEQKVILQRHPRAKACRVSGRVLEANSRKPIEQFQVWVAAILGTHYPSGYPNSVGLAPELRTTGTNGEFSFPVLDSYEDPVERLEVEIKAGGYLPATSAIPGPLTNRVWLNVDLDPIPTLAGTIELPDGRAATGAVVMLAQRAQGSMGYMQLPGQFDLQLSSAPHTQTDDQGRFAITAKSMAGMLLAASPDGFVQLDLESSTPFPVLRLEPWGRVMGTLRVGSQPGANRGVTLGNDYDNLDKPHPFLLTRTATTDAEGHFVMETVPPGEWRLEPHHARVHVRAGETADVQLGGGGLRVVGKIVFHSPTRPDDLNHLQVALNTKWFPIPTPRRNQFASFQQYVAAKNHWWSQQLEFKKSPAGREARRDSRAYSATLQADGKFSFEEVLPGTYELRVGGDPLWLDPIQMSFLSDATTDVLVPEPKPGEAARLDIGVLQIDLTQR
jgi:RNA polymerase sigma factor (sigma-70 family)